MKPATEDGEPPNCGSTARDYDTPASYTVPLSQFSAPLAPVISLKSVNRVPQLKINPTANAFRRVPQALLSGGHGARLERLALAEPQPHPQDR
jgi:hypothetical protein